MKSLAISLSPKIYAVVLSKALFILIVFCYSFKFSFIFFVGRLLKRACERSLAPLGNFSPHFFKLQFTHSCAKSMRSINSMCLLCLHKMKECVKVDEAENLLSSANSIKLKLLKSKFLIQTNSKFVIQTSKVRAAKK